MIYQYNSKIVVMMDLKITIVMYVTPLLINVDVGGLQHQLSSHARIVVIVPL